jgi:serine/threonine protein kinase
MIAFSCPHCHAQLQVKEGMAGKSGPCPNCSKTLQAPAAGSGSQSGSAASGQQTVRPSSAAEDTGPPASERGPLRDYPFLSPPQGLEELGRLGPYSIRRVLGTGAMGVVFQAEDLHLKRPVALKVLKPSLAAFAEYHRRFLREAQLSAALDHEHIVTVYQVGEDRGVPFLAMKLLHGETLEDRLSVTAGGLTPAEVLRIGREVAEGLAAAHAQGLVHRDIKPANVWLEAGGDRVKIVDFGLACGAGEDGRLTQAGAVIGTPAYMAPEQANSEEPDARSDLFSLGAVLYRASTGLRPFPGTDTLSVLAALATTMPAAPRRVVPSLPQDLSDLVMWLLAKDRTERPQSAREVVEAIRAIERGESPPEMPCTLLEDSPPEPAPAEAAPARAPGREVSPPPEEAPEEARVEEATGREVKRKGPAKPRPHAARKKKKQPKVERNWGRIAMWTALVLWVVAIVVIVLTYVRHVRRTSATVSADRDAVPHVSTLHFAPQHSHTPFAMPGPAGWAPPQCDLT